MEAEAWLRAISSWLLANDHDMMLPSGVLDTDPLDIADRLAALTSSAPEPVQKLHELPPGEHICRHCEGKDPHCSVCEGVGSLPSHKGAGE